MRQLRIWRRFGIGFVLILAAGLAGGSQASANSESVIWSFGGPGDGANPYSELITDWRGNYYGTTLNGGANGGGTVFKLTHPKSSQGQWSESVVWSFGGSDDGANPYAGLIKDKNGNLYGTTLNGGTNGAGTVFELTPPSCDGAQWTEQALWDFGSGSDGKNPQAGLVMDSSGNLYGATQYGGNQGYGTVFELTPPSTGQTQWSESVLLSFDFDVYGEYPRGGLIIDPHGNLYGTAFGGGGVSGGTVFQLKPPQAGQTEWTANVLAGFAGSPSGGGASFPESRPLYADGGLFVTTTQDFPINPGAVVEVSPSGFQRTSTIWEFNPGPNEFPNSPFDGAFPAAGVVADPQGNLYGTTVDSNTAANGVVYKLIKPVSGTTWTEQLLWTFGQSPGDGLNPYSSLLYANGYLYGTTANGGTSGAGTVFRVAR